MNFAFLHRFFALAALMAVTSLSLCGADPDLAGRWDLRIEAGGEIYKGHFTIRHADDAWSGVYESDEGRRTRIDSIKLNGNQVKLETRTQRFSVPVTAVFVGDLTNNRIEGETDFSTGAESVSYSFHAIRAVEPGSKLSKPSTPDASVGTRLRKLSFREGTDDYNGTVDVEVWSIAPDDPLDRQGTLTSDGNNGGGESQVLMKFGGLFGDADHQIPRHANIRNATLTVVAFDPGTTVYVHRMLVPWTAASTWNGLASGISINNREASTVRDGFTFGQINMDRQFVQFDVTGTVQRWSSGEPNCGWVFINTGSNGWDFYSSDWHEVDLRPQLTIEYVENSDR